MQQVRCHDRTWSVLSVATLATVVACGQANDGAVPSEAPLFEGIVDLEIGDATGEDAYLFSSIGSIVEDPWGRIVVSDIRLSEIRVFDPDGTFAFAFGRYGEGPGDFNGLCCMQFGPDGLLWVREFTRYSVFRMDSAGVEFERVVQSPHLGAGGLIAPFLVDGEGGLISVGPVWDEEGFSSKFARIHLHADGARDTVLLASAERQAAGQTTVAFERGGMRGQAYIYQPLGPLWIHAHANNGAWAEAVTSEYVVNLHQPDGTLLQIVGPAIEGPELTASEREWAQTRIDRDLERIDLASHPFGIPDRKPLLDDLFFDDAGRLWVTRTRAGGTDMDEADAWEGTSLVARYRWPARVSVDGLGLVTDSRLYGTTTDSLGVPRVARVRFRPAG